MSLKKKNCRKKEIPIERGGGVILLKEEEKEIYV